MLSIYAGVVCRGVASRLVIAKSRYSIKRTVAIYRSYGALCSRVSVFVSHIPHPTELDVIVRIKSVV